MRKEGQLIALMGTYSAILLIVCILGISMLYKKKTEPIPPETVIETVIKTEEVYILVDGEEDSQTTEKVGEVLFIVKEYEEKIGVFDPSGRLLQTIDIYAKTLPQTDRALLREGIELRSKTELTALIEDYSS